MGSLMAELEAREAAAQARAEALRARIAELTEQLTVEEELCSRLGVTRRTVLEILGGGAGSGWGAVEGVDGRPGGVEQDGDAGVRAALRLNGPVARAGLEAAPVAARVGVGVVTVPQWQAGVEEVVLPVAYRDVLEVFADAARPLRASCCPPPWPSGWASSRPQTSSSTWASSSLARCAGTGFSRLATSGLGATHSASSIAVCTGNQLGFGGLFARLTSWRCSRHRPD